MLCQHGRGVVCHECHDTIGRLCADLNAANAEITRLRAELAEARAALGTAKHQRDEWMRFCDKVERELAEARESASKYHAELAEARAERDEARRERDARPDITVKDAASWLRCDSDENEHDGDAGRAFLVVQALRAHAASAAKGGE